MSSRDLLSMSLRNLWRRKLRTFLTLLGVMIGATSIVIMLSLGLAIQEQQESMLERMGSLSTITVTSPDISSSKSVRKVYLDDKAVSELASISGVQAVAPIISGELTILSYGNYRSFLTVQGIKPNYFRDFEIDITEGRDLRHSNKNCIQVIIPSNVREFLYSPTRALDATKDKSFDPLRSRMILGSRRNPDLTFTAQVVGVYASSGFNMDVFILEEDMNYLLEKLGTSRADGSARANIYTQLQVKVDDVAHVQTVRDAITEKGYQTRSLQDFAEEMNQGTLIIQAVLGGIGSISLIVAAIGIANTMVMSIYERTKEIGIMKVIGASVRDIRQIFLTEASLIGLLGGVLGISLSIGISQLLNFIFSRTEAGIRLGDDAVISIIPPWLILLSLIFSSLIGLMAGYYPAKRATKLSAIEAIKTE